MSKTCLVNGCIIETMNEARKNEFLSLYQFGEIETVITGGEVGDGVHYPSSLYEKAGVDKNELYRLLGNWLIISDKITREIGNLNDSKDKALAIKAIKHLASHSMNHKWANDHKKELSELVDGIMSQVEISFSELGVSEELIKEYRKIETDE